MYDAHALSVPRVATSNVYESTLTSLDSCVDPLTLNELQRLGEADAPGNLVEGSPIDANAPLSYGTIRGSERLRSLIASTISPNTGPEDVLVTSGAISANFLVLDTLLGPGDHVVCQYPTYGQLFEVPKRAGAKVGLWPMHEDPHFGLGGGQLTLDSEELIGLLQEDTKMIVINSPSNPTGTVLNRRLLYEIVEVARQNDLFVLCDEVFRPLFHDLSPNDARPPSLLEFDYEKLIVTGSMSKAYALPGIRLGWVRNQPDRVYLLTAGP